MAYFRPGSPQAVAQEARAKSSGMATRSIGGSRPSLPPVNPTRQVGYTGGNPSPSQNGGVKMVNGQPQYINPATGQPRTGFQTPSGTVNNSVQSTPPSPAGNTPRGGMSNSGLYPTINPNVVKPDWVQQFESLGSMAQILDMETRQRYNQWRSANTVYGKPVFNQQTNKWEVDPASIGAGATPPPANDISSVEFIPNPMTGGMIPNPLYRPPVAPGAGNPTARPIHDRGVTGVDVQPLPAPVGGLPGQPGPSMAPTVGPAPTLGPGLPGTAQPEQGKLPNPFTAGPLGGPMASGKPESPAAAATKPIHAPTFGGVMPANKAGLPNPLTRRAF